MQILIAIAGCVLYSHGYVTVLHRARGRRFISPAAPFLSPTHLPFAGVLEQEVWNVCLVAICSSWSCLGMTLAYHARHRRLYDVSLEEVITGQYLETSVRQSDNLRPNSRTDG